MLISSYAISQEKTASTSCFQLISGTIVDKNSDEIIKNATVKVFDGNNLIKTITSSSKGSFNIKVDCGKSYYLLVHKPEFNETKKSFTTSNASNIRVEVTLYLVSKNKLDCTEIFNGRVSDEFTNAPINGVTVEIRNTKNQLIATEITNTNGNYHFNLPCKQKYIVRYTKKGFIETTTEIKTTKTNKKIQRRDVTLHIKLCNQQVKGVVLDAKTQKPLKNITITILKDDIELKKIKTNNEGLFNSELKCGTNYTLQTKATDFQSEIKQITTSTENNKIENIEFQLYAIVNNNSSTEITTPKITKKPVIFNINPFNFEINSAEITEDIAIELDKIVGLLMINSTLKVTLNSYTDSRGPAKYNLNLSEARAQSMIAYVISKGVEASRVTGKGFGETNLRYDCTKEKGCTEYEHKQNKRNEFIFSQ